MVVVTEYRVIIIGAGPAGLITAHALEQQGIKTSLFEQDVAIAARPRDWNFGVYWGRNPLSECLPKEIYSQLAELQVDDHIPTENDTIPIHHGATGELLKAIPAPLSLRLHRKKFLRVLSTGLDIKYNKRLSRVESDGVTATAFFENGTSANSNLIIGAEGAHSVVRDFLVGKMAAELVPTPIVASVTIANLPEDVVTEWKKLHHRNVIAFHPEGYFYFLDNHETNHDIPPSERRYMIIVSWLASPDHDPSTVQGSAILPDLKERAKIFAEPFKSILTSIPDGTQCWHNRLSSWSPQNWDNRKSTVTLVGDAAHAMTFHRGQGLNNAIHDAASLASCFKENGIPIREQIAAGQTAIDAYEREMHIRGAEAVDSNLQNSIITHEFEKLMESPLFTSGLNQKVKRT